MNKNRCLSKWEIQRLGKPMERHSGLQGNGWRPTTRCLCTPLRAARPLPHQVLVRIWGNRNWHPSPVGMQKAPLLWKSLAVSYKTKPTLSIRSSSRAPWNIHKGDENSNLRKNLPMSVYSCFLLDCQIWEPLRRPSAGGWKRTLWSVRQWSFVVAAAQLPRHIPTLCDPMDCSTAGLPVPHHLLEPAQVHVQWNIIQH